MYTGRRFRLNTPTLGIDSSGQKPQAVLVPAGSVIQILKGPSETDPMVLIQWGSMTLTMFVLDVRERGEEAVEATAD
jgi:hypothetical protein